MKERETADVQSNQSNLARRAFCKNASIDVVKHNEWKNGY
jgi:hypothetical protein